MEEDLKVGVEAEKQQSSNPDAVVYDVDEEDIATQNSDDAMLASMGYKPQFFRILSAFDNFSASFGVCGFVSGVTALYGYAMLTGGPQAAFVNWLIVSMMAVITSLVMAEICSSMPTAGGIYFWAGRLGGQRFGPFLAWLTAIWNFAGWTASIAAVAQGTCLFVISMYMLDQNPDFEPYDSKNLYKQFLITSALIMISFFLNIVNERVVQIFLRVSSWIFFVQYWLYIIWMPIKVPRFNTAHEVYYNFINETGWENNKGIVWLLGLLYPAYVFFGFDASAHIAEETTQATQKAARGMWSSMVISMVFSIPQLVVMLHCTNFEAVLSSPFPQAVVSVWVYAVGKKGAYVFLMFQIVTGIATNCSVILSAARVAFAISRDDILPLSRFGEKQTPEDCLLLLLDLSLD
eukprot:TRINITY_DN15103_c0_g1_i1.p1 TRINITY_DN15103_c0_g1~~TRINITY_DN15103_c0_g1_i1.p1  ORF type:complete len:405 (+),score=73.14 TRINITY_DN15103_c0_g1_i1:34-1248(+)